ncbi:Mitochondrial translocator assembly and maintenance protein 41 [Coemansia sp. Benny D115]|nr:Mitochondrial translocator assembly and maintenance protein 41 [Coemansia sp. Benny D115]
MNTRALECSKSLGAMAGRHASMYTKTVLRGGLQVRQESRLAVEDKKDNVDDLLLMREKEVLDRQQHETHSTRLAANLSQSKLVAGGNPAQKMQASVGRVQGIPSLSESEERRLDEMRTAQSEIRDELQGVLKEFAAPIRYAFAYGSGVYKQSGYAAGSKPMVDLIFGVSHPDHWHAINLGRNRHHYSFLGSFGSGAVTIVQDRLGAGVYFNPFVEINGIMVKYGVVSMDTLSSDLLNWETLYLAGRMHKPTLTLRRDPLMRISKQVNLTHAVRVALLMLPKNFTSQELFQTIAGLSFAGDFRMKIGGENPEKVRNIVEAQMPLFKSRYSSIIEGLPNLEYIGQDILQQDMSAGTRAAMLRKMPNNFYNQLVRQGRKAGGGNLPPGLGAEMVNSQKLVALPDIEKIAQKAVESIVARPALTQSLKGLLTSGMSKSIAYMRAKNDKYQQANKNNTKS